MKANINKISVICFQNCNLKHPKSMVLIPFWLFSKFRCLFVKRLAIAKTWAKENYSRIAVAETKSADEYMIEQYNKNVTISGVDYANSGAGRWV